RWLRGVEQIVLNHPQIGDEALRYVGEMAALNDLTLRRTKMSDRGMALLQGLQNLQTLSVLYVPLSDAAVDSLGTLQGLTSLRLYGTGLTAAGRDQLAQALPAAKIDVRRGAFLGIGCDPTQQGCVIFMVRPGTAAEKAGLAIGDLIERY